MKDKQPTDHPLIPFKSFNISQITKRLDKVAERMRNHWHSEPTGEKFESFVRDLYSCFPWSTRFDAFYASLLPHAGQCMTPAHIRNIAWRLAGNLKQLKAGQPVSPWLQQNKLEWVPIVLVRAVPARSGKGTLGYLYTYRVLAGSPAGKQFEIFWTVRFVKNMARSLGFRKRRKSPFIFTDGIELVQMKLYILLDPTMSRDTQPGAWHFMVTPSFLTANRRILKRRFRITPCPIDKPLIEWPCHQCPIGYLPDNRKGAKVPRGCYASCHPMTYADKTCPRCKSADVAFDPLGKGVICVECENNERRGQPACSNDSETSAVTSSASSTASPT